MTDSHGQTVLIVDLDKTLIKTDLLVESFLSVLKRQPLVAVRAVFALSQGRAEVKRILSEAADIDVKRLPYNEDVLNLIRKHKATSGKVVLASASDQRYVGAIAEHLGLFDEWHGTTQKNLKGEHKLAELAQRYDLKTATYVGDSHADLALWEAGLRAVVVNPSRTLQGRLRSRNIMYHTVGHPQRLLPELVRACRVHQWSKNALVFLPLIAAGQFSDLNALALSALAALAFSMTASCVYLLNDMLDIEADRRHAKKCKRPFAAGTLPVEAGFIAIPALAGLATAAAIVLPAAFGGVLITYFASNLLYSFRLKKVIALDVVLLATMYGMRVLAGGVAAGITVSTWLLAFCTMFFFGLAVLKRYTEVAKLLANKASGRGYKREDKSALLSLGVGGSLLSVLVFILYLSSPAVVAIYTRPDLLWLIALVLLVWVSRIWLLATRGEVDDDPVVFALKDKSSYVMAGLTFALLILAHQ